MIRIDGASPIGGSVLTDVGAVGPAVTELPSANTLVQSVEGAAKGITFEDVFKDAVKESAAMSKQSAEAGRRLAEGLSDDLHGTMIAGKKAELSLKLVGSIRNKLLDAFHEIWRMNV